MYFNTAGAAPLPNCVVESLSLSMQRELFTGRANKGERSFFQNKLSLLRDLVSSMIGASADEIAITSNTTEAINVIVWGMNLDEGSEILTTNAEHLGALASLSTLHKLRNVDIKFFDCYENNIIFDVHNFFEMITPNTKLIVLSHVFWESGNINPIRDVCIYAKKMGIPVLIDGAQAVGNMPINVKELGVDFYVFPAHKWLLGPEGIGFMYISNDKLATLNQTFAGNASFLSHDGKIDFVPSIGAKRFEIGTRFRPIIDGMITGLDWLTKDIGFSNIYEKTNNNMGIFKNYIDKETSLNLVTNNVSSIASISLPKKINARIVRKELEKLNIYVNDIKRLNSIRVSIGFFNDEEQINKLVNYINKFI
ncbi:aminotransferase class V-fold PLP-dependent enzyme [Priestia filamentosa]|uniref:aminotransferase class V-fold PLP-dependent enzyme n=1 Tax=Priestia filamentosa TaxID=1402861 RepID=UPI003F18B44E